MKCRKEKRSEGWSDEVAAANAGRSRRSHSVGVPGNNVTEKHRTNRKDGGGLIGLAMSRHENGSTALEMGDKAMGNAIK